MDTESGRVVAREECPKCGSSDNVALYEDGHRHCFSMACGYHTGPEGSERPQRRTTKMASLLEGEYRAIPKRALTKEALQRFGVMVAQFDGEPVLAMNYRNAAGEVVAQKIRKIDKQFRLLGETRDLGLFGQHLWQPSDRLRVVVTEGELDAVALCQAQDLKWPVVSIPSGASNARKDIAKAAQWLEGFKEVVLAFDADDAGRKAAVDAAAVLRPGRVRIADFGPFGFKDANEAIQKGDERNLLKAVMDARPYRPDGVVSLADIETRVLTPLEEGRPWPWPALTKVTFGRRLGDVLGFGAGTGCGKTDLFTQTIAHDVRMGIKCGLIYLEQGVGETGKRIAGKMVGKRFHVPDGSWTQAELEAAWSDLKATEGVWLYDNFGAADWSTVRGMIRYLHEVCGCTHIFLDHLTALVAGEADENVALKGIMADLAGDAKGRFVLHYISHLTTPEGTPHEEGGRVMMRHFRGSRAIGYWSHAAFGLERDQTADDPHERRIMTIRCLKDRLTGQSTGETVALLYDPETGTLNEHDPAIDFANDDNDGMTAEAAGF